MAKRTLVRSGCVITMDKQVGDFESADILIEDGKILQVGPDLDADEAKVIEVSGCIVLPGFVDTHRHNWQSIVHNIGADWTLGDYLQGMRGMLGWHYRPEDLYAANLLGRVEALDSGITTMLDWSHLMNSPEHADAAIEGLRDSGGRSVFAYGDSNEGWNPLPSPIPQSEDARRVRSQHFSSDDQLVTMAMAIRGPQFSTTEVTEHDFRLARDLGCRITTHVGDGLWGITYPAIEMLDELGLLADDTTYVHCNTTTDAGLKMMADTGGTASVAAPIEMLMGHGFPATGRLLQAGIRPSLSVDVVSVNGGDMFGLMRATLTCERALANDKALQAGTTLDVLPITTRDVLEFATIEGARAVGLDDRIGSLTPGKQADLIVVRPDNAGMYPLSNPVGAVVLATQVQNVTTVLVGGKVVKRDGVLESVDISRVRDLGQQARDDVLEKAGLSGRVFDWQLEPLPEWSGAS
jgi:5-methylthioadenosine/S-adenosylhomocysteine deaminase